MIKLASIFTDHMVVQAYKDVWFFGEGEGSASVKFNGQTVQSDAKDGKWAVKLEPMEYGGPYDMEFVSDGKAFVLKDIYVGEVWFAGGQSNMEMPLFRTEGGLNEAKTALNEKIRFFTVPRRFKKKVDTFGWHFEKTVEADKAWEICTEQSALSFTAIGYYVAKGLYEKLGVAVGVISCNWGATPIEPYIARKHFYEHEFLRPQIDEVDAYMKDLDWENHDKEFDEWTSRRKATYDSIDDAVEVVRQIGVRAAVGIVEKEWEEPYGYGIYHIRKPAVLFESMISEVSPFAMKGVLWYQGESNASDSGKSYADKYLVFMKSFREAFKDDTIPFYAVELAPYDEWYDENRHQDRDDRFITDVTNWAYMREQQQKAVEIGDNNYLVTTMGIGDPYDIHPIHKEELSHRMLLKVLKHSYGFDIYADQPVMKSAEFKDGKAILEFDNAEGLFSRQLLGVKMYVSDETHILKRAKVQIDGNKLILENENVKNPVLARYAFDMNYNGPHIYNKAGLPMAPFRTDK